MAEYPENASDRRPVPDPTVLTTEQLLREISSLKEVLLTRIVGIEALTEEKFTAGKVAVDAALRAAKDAAAKSEAATEKQIDRIVALIEQKSATSEVQISDLKDRFNRSDGKGFGIQSAWGILVAVITLAALVFGAVMAVKH